MGVAGGVKRNCKGRWCGDGMREGGLIHPQFFNAIRPMSTPNLRVNPPPPMPSELYRFEVMRINEPPGG